MYSGPFYRVPGEIYVDFRIRPTHASIQWGDMSTFLQATSSEYLPRDIGWPKCDDPR